MNIGKLQEFTSYLDEKGGGLIPQKWRFVFNKPTGRGTGNPWFDLYDVSSNDDYKELSLACTTATIPGRSLSTGEVHAPGPEQKYPYQDVFEDLELTFLCTAGKLEKKQKNIVIGLKERRFMDAWMAQICDPTTMLFNYSDEYATTIELIPYNSRNNVISAYRFHRVYPLQIGPIEFTHDATELATFTVTFNYDRWTYLDPILYDPDLDEPT